MFDAGLSWGDDVSISATGDISLTAGAALGQERLLRRLLTNPKDYTWQPEYGAGCGLFVGGGDQARFIEGQIRSAIRAEPAVAASPAPVVSVIREGSAVLASITYTDSQSLTTQTLSFSLEA